MDLHIYGAKKDTYVYRNLKKHWQSSVCICEREIYSWFSISTNINIGRYPTYICIKITWYIYKIWFLSSRGTHTSIYNIWSAINYSHIPTVLYKVYMESTRKQNAAKFFIFFLAFLNQCFTGFWFVLWTIFEFGFQQEMKNCRMRQIDPLLLTTNIIKSHYML